MKTIKVRSAIFVMLLLPAVLFAQKEKKTTEVIYIQTSAICDECKGTIEAALKKVDGVKSSDLNLTDKKIMVKYYPDKVSPDQIKVAISKSGYDADDVAADADAYSKLMMCCKKDAEKH